MLFIDGANLYRRLLDDGARDPNLLDLRLVARKLAGPREVVGIRYYTGKAEASAAIDGKRVLAAQQRLFAALARQGVDIIRGRLEKRSERNPLADELLRFLATPPAEIDRLQPELYKALHRMAMQHREAIYWVQKAVDTAIAVEIAQMAIDDQYDVAYVLSQDGDMAPGIRLARSGPHAKKVFAVGPAGRNYHIMQACDRYIVINREWLRECYLPDR